jgi:hypothetical protein
MRHNLNAPDVYQLFGWRTITLDFIRPRWLVSDRFVIEERENRRNRPVKDLP